MSKLISAGFARLFRQKTFIIAIIFIVLLNALVIIPEKFNTSVVTVSVTTSGSTEAAVPAADNMPFAVDGYFMETPVLLLIIAAVIIGNFIGAEYGFGTIRNKLAVGHARAAIYFADYIVCLSAVLMILLVGYASVFAIGLPLGAAILNTAEYLLTQFLLNVLYCFAITAIYVFLAVNILSKSANLTVSILVAFTILFANVMIVNMLMEPEYTVPKQTIYNSDGEEIGEKVIGDPMPNPFYIGGTKRTIFETVDTMLPISSVIEYQGEVDAGKVAAMAGELVIFTAAGLIIFRKRDLK